MKKGSEMVTPCFHPDRSLPFAQREKREERGKNHSLKKNLNFLRFAEIGGFDSFFSKTILISETETNRAKQMKILDHNGDNM